MLKPPLGLIQGKEKDLLRQVQELFCLRQLVVSYDLSSEKANFLEKSLEKVIFDKYRDSQLSQLGKVNSSWYQLSNLSVTSPRKSNWQWVVTDMQLRFSAFPVASLKIVPGPAVEPATGLLGCGWKFFKFPPSFWIQQSWMPQLLLSW